MFSCKETKRNNSLENANLVKSKTFSKHRSSVQPVGQWRETKGGKERKRIKGNKRQERKRGRKRRMERLFKIKQKSIKVKSSYYKIYLFIGFSLHLLEFYM